MDIETRLREIIELFVEFADRLRELELYYTDVKAKAILAIGRHLRDKMVEFRDCEDCPDDIRELIDKELPAINDRINQLDVEFGVN